ncbi:hypothetical protein [Arhodomonas sp. AD133]|uniref:hypothetical protein n=1 Tax=Arhodomonas sp. AD133 TaxID=3415009 RepID=UPI003EBB0AB1
MTADPTQAISLLSSLYTGLLLFFTLLGAFFGWIAHSLYRDIGDYLAVSRRPDPRPDDLRPQQHQ